MNFLGANFLQNALVCYDCEIHHQAEVGVSMKSFYIWSSLDWKVSEMQRVSKSKDKE